MARNDELVAALNLCVKAFEPVVEEVAGTWRRDAARAALFNARCELSRAQDCAAVDAAKRVNAHDGLEAVRAAVLAWWDEHQYDACRDGDGDERNVYDETPAMVRLALAGENGADRTNVPDECPIEGGSDA